MLIAPCIVTTIGVLDLDHLGAEIGERLGASRPGHDPGEVHHQQTHQRNRRALLAWRATGNCGLAVMIRPCSLWRLRRTNIARHDFKVYFRKGNTGKSVGGMRALRFKSFQVIDLRQYSECGQAHGVCG